MTRIFRDYIEDTYPPCQIYTMWHLHRGQKYKA